jgi:hypothetical protein
MSNLSDLLANRTWLRRSWPFPHVTARNVFHPDVYAAIAAQLQGFLNLSLSEKPDRGRFSRNIAGYDAYGIGFNPAIPDPIAVFLSTDWRGMISSLFGIGVTPYIFAGAHHHTVGSKNGFIHNDFNPVWFPCATGEGVQVPNNEVCAYKTGEGSLIESEKVQVVRGVAVLFFLLNDGWRPGDGGELGLYSSAKSEVSEPALPCAPINNSLVAFECTPESFHTFLTNRRRPRTSIIMWVHRPLDEAIAKFGAERLERWKT